MFPPTLEWNGASAGAWHIAAAVAGARGFSAPQQPLTSMQLESGWTYPSSMYGFNGYLKTLADYGMFVIGPTPDFLAAMVEYPYTSDQSILRYGREQVVATENCIRSWLATTFDGIRGLYSVSATAFAVIRTDILEAMQQLQNGSPLPNFGPVVLNWIITDIYQDPNQADAIVVAMTVTVPIGVDLVTIDLTVTL